MTDRASDRPSQSPTVAVLPDGTPVTLVTPDGAKRPVLGTREPAEADEVARRVKTLEAWGHRKHSPVRASPRRQWEGAIEQALPLRTRTILSHELPPDVAEIVNGSR